MGKRSKHKGAQGRVGTLLVKRPFEGVPGECDLVAMREIVPAATGSWTLTAEHGAAEVTVATLLPLSWPALVRSDGRVMVGLQVNGASSDVSRDVADVLLRALDAEPGTQIQQGGLPGPGPRLQDILNTTVPFVVDLREGFDYWVEGVEAAQDDENTAAALASANAALVPTQRLASVEAAYWCHIGNREHLRWVLPHDEDAVTTAFARLHARGADAFGAGSRYIGAFRAHGLAVPVWDVPDGSSAESLNDEVAALSTRLSEALADTAPLTSDERRARQGLLARQVTIR